MDDTTQIRRLVPIPETRRLLGNIGHSTVYELVGRGELVKVNIGRRAFVTSDSINAYMDRLAAHGREVGGADGVDADDEAKAV